MIQLTSQEKTGGRSAPTKEHQNINSSSQTYDATFLQRGMDCKATERAAKGHKHKSSCLATGIACLGGRSAPTKEHQNINSSTFKHTMPHFYNVERTAATERATKGHTNPNLPAWQAALIVYTGGPLLPKNTKISSLPRKHTMPHFYDSVERIVATERATKGHTNDTHQEYLVW